MNVSQRSNKLTLTFCGGNAAMCPRMSITGRDAKFADDYHGDLKVNKKLLQKFFVK